VATYLSKKTFFIGPVLTSGKILKLTIYFLSVLIVFTGIIIFKPWGILKVLPQKEKTGTIAPSNAPSVKTEINLEKSPSIVTDDFIDEGNSPILKSEITLEEVTISEMPSVGKNPPTSNSSILSNRAEKASEFIEEAKKALYQDNDASKALKSAEEALKKDPESQLAKDLKEAAEEKLAKQKGDIK
jgi:hypothetical protein